MAQASNIAGIFGALQAGKRAGIAAGIKPGAGFAAEIMSLLLGQKSSHAPGARVSSALAANHAGGLASIQSKAETSETAPAAVTSALDFSILQLKHAPLAAAPRAPMNGTITLPETFAKQPDPAVHDALAGLKPIKANDSAPAGTVKAPRKGEERAKASPPSPGLPQASNAQNAPATANAERVLHAAAMAAAKSVVPESGSGNGEPHPKPAQIADVEAAPVSSNQSANALRNAPASAHEPHATRAHAQPAIEQVALAIARRAKDGATRFDIRLDPPELGRVDVRLDFSADGKVTAALAAERAETYDLLRRDANTLARALAEAGVNVDSGGLAFSLAEERQRFLAANLPAFRAEAPDSAPAVVTEALNLRFRDGIDIRV